MEQVFYPTRKSLENVAKFVKVGLAAADRPQDFPWRCLLADAMQLALEGIARELNIMDPAPYQSPRARRAGPTKRHRHHWVDHPASKATFIIERCDVPGCFEVRSLVPKGD